MSTLDNFRKEAKRWLKALRTNDAEARARLVRAYPKAPPDSGLRDVQHALAREHGYESWRALKSMIEQRQALDMRVAATGGRTHAERVATFLTFACWDHHTHGKGDHRMSDRAAARLLAQHPEISHDSLYTAIVCGDRVEVERLLATRPEAAREPGGSRGWTPILYLCFTRFTHQPTIDNALDIARLLLDHGANPNDYYMAGDARYSALTGIAGEGEQDSPRQPYASELFQLLLERGAEPFDIQVLYDTHFSGDMLWWLELIYAHTMKIGRTAEWADPNWSMLDMGGYGPGASFLLSVAVRKNDLRLAEWLLSHGASPNATSSHPKFKGGPALYQQAVREGFDAMADLLVRYGASTAGPAPTDEEQFIRACFRLDREAVRAQLVKHPEYLQSPAAMFAAAAKDRPDVIEFLLDLGVPLEVQGARGERALHQAASRNALRAAKLLIDRGAEIDPRESAYGATPIGWAGHGDRLEMLEFLSHYSRNVWTLAFRGYVDRLREVLREEPERARAVTSEGVTPLWWLPDDESKALEIVELLLAAGANPASRSSDGTTAADWALQRGMRDVARRLGVFGAAKERFAAPPPDLQVFERLAQDLVFAYETGQPAAMQHLMKHFDATITWEGLREEVRKRLEALGSERPDGYFALPHARLLIARGAGFESWAALAKLFERPAPAVVEASASIPPAPPFDLTAPMIQPVEMRMTFPFRFHDGTVTTTTDVWNMLTATRHGDLERVKELVAACPSLVRCDYNYMPPLHLAVREGHTALVRYLVEQGAGNPKYVTYPYKEPLVTVALDRGYDEIAQVLEEHFRNADPAGEAEEGGEIDYGRDEQRVQFQKLVRINALAEVEALLRKRPELALDELAFWGEGILMMPAKGGHRRMLELLIRYGARVPTVSKWGAWYYFNHYDTAVFLLDNGMDPNHMNCHHTTLLHDMAYTGDARKAQLLLERGADINAVDEEFRSTPLGLAARFGQPEIVALLLERDADPNLSGASWATPLAWARKKGHSRIESDLVAAGAR